jgi:uncharacterized UBP type Zn finger protein
VGAWRGRRHAPSKSATNCLGLINVGNSFYVTAVYKVSTPANFNIKRS